MIIELHPDDPRLGVMDADGNYPVWPQTDIHGKPYTRAEATVQRLNESAFVVLPHSCGDEVVLLDADPLPFTDAAEEVVHPDGTVVATDPNKPFEVTSPELDPPPEPKSGKARR